MQNSRSLVHCKAVAVTCACGHAGLAGRWAVQGRGRWRHQGAPVQHVQGVAGTAQHRHCAQVSASAGADVRMPLVIQVRAHCALQPLIGGCTRKRTGCTP